MHNLRMPGSTLLVPEGFLSNLLTNGWIVVVAITVAVQAATMTSLSTGGHEVI